MVTITEVMPKERLDRYIEEAARVAGYQEGFGVWECDLSHGLWWAAYIRQSTKEQAENDRIGEYLLTCARKAKELNVIVPHEFIIYDSVTSEHLGRPGIKRLRTELIPQKLITGIIIPTLGRLSCDDHHRLTFEKECCYYGVEFVYGDAPSGMDIGSMFARSGMSLGNYLRVKTNRESALGGNIARVLAGKVPPGKAPYGYRYFSKAETDSRGRRKILEATWEVDEIDDTGVLVWGTPAWVVQMIFNWVGVEHRTQYWVAAILNKWRQDYPTLFRPLYGDNWVPKTIGEICARECYTGKGVYNKNKRVPNPNKPLEDLTDEIPRTLLRPKPESEWIYFDVPSLTTKELYDSANTILRERGRGRGKQGKEVEALLRGRINCPLCSWPMSVKRKSNGKVYYYCRDHYSSTSKNPCSYRRFIPATWDEQIWSEITSMLRDDAWVNRQLDVEIERARSIDQIVKKEQSKIEQNEAKIVRVKQGYDGGIYSLQEAKDKIANYQDMIGGIDSEIQRLQTQIKGFTPKEMDELKEALRILRDRNIEEATFEDRMDLMARLGVQVYPSEDLKSRRIKCCLSNSNTKGEQVSVAKVVSGRPYRSRTCDTLIKNQLLLSLPH